MLRSVFTLINVCFVLLLYSQSPISSQEDVSSVTNFQSQFQSTLPNSLNSEGIKLHLTTSSYFYDVGETVYFNAMILNSGNLQPVLYNLPCRLTLMNPQGQVLSSMIIESVAGCVNNNFSPAYFKAGGEYEIVAECLLNGKKVISRRSIVVQQTIERSAFIEVHSDKEQYIAGDLLQLKINIRLGNGAIASNRRVIITELYKDKAVDTSVVYTDILGMVLYNRQIAQSYSENDLVFMVRVLENDVWEVHLERIQLNTGRINISIFPENGAYKTGAASGFVIFTSNDLGDLTTASCILYNVRTGDSSFIETNAFGFGKFTLPPDDSLHHYVLFTGKNRKLFYQLQAFRESRFRISVLKKREDFITYRLLSDTFEKVRFVGHLRGKILLDTTFMTGLGEAQVTLQTGYLMPGVLQVLVFNQRDEILAQKLNFINREKRLKVSTTMSPKVVLPQNQYRLDFKVTDENNTPVEGVFNLAITDHRNTLLIEDRQSGISENLLFESDLQYPAKDIGKLWQSPVTNNDSALDIFLNGCKLNDIYLPGILKRSHSKTVCYYQFILEDRYSWSNSSLRRDVRSIVIKSDVCKYKTTINDMNEIYIPSDSISFPARIFVHGNGGKEIIYVNETHVKIALKTAKDPAVTSINQDTFYSPDGQMAEVIGTPVLQVAVKDNNAYFIDGVRVFAGDMKMSCSLSCYRSFSTKNLYMTGKRDLNSLAALCSGVTRTSTGLSGRGSRPDATAYFIDGVRILSVNDIPGYTGGPPQLAYYGGYNGYSGQYTILPRYSVKKYRPNGVAMDTYQHSSYEFGNGTDKEKMTTYYWETGITTNANGEFSKFVKMPKKTMLWHIDFNGIGKDGLLGEYDTTVQIQQEVYVKVKAPERLLNSDTAIVVYTIYNNSSVIQYLQFKAELPYRVYRNNLLVPAGGSREISLSYHTGISGIADISISDRNGKVVEELTHEIRIDERRYITEQINSLLVGKKEVISIPASSEKVEAVINLYHSGTENLETQLMDMITEPHGCFEQVSSINYPNILAYRYLKNSILNEEEKVEMMRKREFLISGYAKLVSYETAGGGFSWYGDGKGNEALTAMGLLQFEKLKECDIEVSEALIARSKAWLLKSRNNSGTFVQSAGRYGFSNTNPDVAHAYITYVLSELGQPGLEMSIKRIKDNLTERPNLYNEALLFAVFLKQKDLEQARKYYDRLLTKTTRLMKAGGLSRESIYTIVNSGYGSALNESLCIIANSIFSGGYEQFKPLAQRIGNYIADQDFNSLGNMQTKAMAIETIHYFTIQRRNFKSDERKLSIEINDHIIQVDYNPEKSRIIDISGHLHKGENTIAILGDSTMWINGDLTARQYLGVPPFVSKSADLKLSSTFSSTHLKAGEVLNYAVEIVNTSDKILPQTIAIVHLPAGVNLNPSELIFLKKNHIVDYYEILDGRIVFYFEEMAAKQEIRFTLPLICEVKGVFDTRGNSVYKYYQPEYKSICLSGKIVID